MFVELKGEVPGVIKDLSGQEAVVPARHHGDQPRSDEGKFGKKEMSQEALGEQFIVSRQTMERTRTKRAARPWCRKRWSSSSSRAVGKGGASGARERRDTVTASRSGCTGLSR